MSSYIHNFDMQKACHLQEGILIRKRSMYVWNVGVLDRVCLFVRLLASWWCLDKRSFNLFATKSKKIHRQKTFCTVRYDSGKDCTIEHELLSKEAEDICKCRRSSQGICFTVLGLLMWVIREFGCTNVTERKLLRLCSITGYIRRERSIYATFVMKASTGVTLRLG